MTDTIRDPGPFDDYFDRNVLSVQRSAGDVVADEDVMVVERVGASSIAARIGIQPGDLLLTLDGVGAARAPKPIPGETRRCTFRGHGELVEVETTGVPLGCTLRRTNAATASLYRAGRVDEDALTLLWNDRDAQLLASVLAPAVAPRPPGFLGRLFGSPPRPVPPSQITLLHGAALHDLGDHSAGMALIEEYEGVASGWTSNYHAILGYYLALEELADLRDDVGLGLLGDAYRTYPFDRIAREIALRTGERPEFEDPWFGRSFPTDYELTDLHDPVRSISLDDLLGGLDPHQVALVCLLARYRGNGPYSDFMRRYRRVAETMSEFVPDLHVLTMSLDRGGDPPHWYSGEDAAREAGVPFRVLLDEHGAVTRAIAPAGSPHTMVLSRSGTIVHNGPIDEACLWDAIDRAARE